MYIIYLKKKQTIIRLPLIINTIFCALAHTCFPLYCIIMYNCTAKEIKLQKEVKVASQATMGCISMKSIRSSIISLVHAVCIHQNFLHRVYTNLNSSFLDPSFLEWRFGCKTCIVYTGL
jgi:hypothetical protein